MILTTTNTVELSGTDILAIAELAEARRVVAKLEERQKAIRAALLAKLDAAGATVGTIDGNKAVSIVESSRPVLSANKVRDLYPAVWAELGTVTEFRSIRLDAPSIV